MANEKGSDKGIANKYVVVEGDLTLDGDCITQCTEDILLNCTIGTCYFINCHPNKFNKKRIMYNFMKALYWEGCLYWTKMAYMKIITTFIARCWNCEQIFNINYMFSISLSRTCICFKEKKSLKSNSLKCNCYPCNLI